MIKIENIVDLTLEELIEKNSLLGFKNYISNQIFDWIHNKRVFSFNGMSNISKDNRELLNRKYQIGTLKEVECQNSSNRTIKFLFELNDGNKIETVLMKQNYGWSVCVTTQVGCNMGCGFCASGQLKKVKDLSSGEIIQQVLYAQKYLDNTNERVSHIIVMGIGEPFDNFENTMKFIEIVNSEKGLNIGLRHITISTSGVVPIIRKFADMKSQVNLAISLHSAISSKRSKIMPINDAYPLDELLEAIKYYENKTNRRSTIEYILLSGINDGIEDLRALLKFTRGLNTLINLIPYNQVEGNEYKRTSKKQIQWFFNELKKERKNVTLRQEFGVNIDAACGQLRAKKI